MATHFVGTHLGNKRVHILHEPSGAVITTDAPPDNNGDGTRFSPTDLVAAALGSCIMTIIDNISERDGFSVLGMHMQLEKQMSTGSPRRIASLPVSISLPKHLLPEQRERLERAAKACPVHHSLHPDVSVQLTFLYTVETP